MSTAWAVLEFQTGVPLLLPSELAFVESPSP